MKTNCYHCGDECKTLDIKVEEKNFCCSGCKTVYQIFEENNLTCYYDMQSSPGATPPDLEGRFDYLENEEIVEKLIDFTDDSTTIVNFYIPHIHCSSCIWILENLQKLNKAIVHSDVNFPEKTVRITFSKQKTNLKELVTLLASIGYEPYISLEDFSKKEKEVDRSLIYKIGIAGFAFGNVMFLSFPEYFEVSEYWLDQYKPIFRWLMFAFSIPVVFYSGQDYFISAYKGLKTKLLNIDIPIALGIFVLFVRSSVEIIFDLGTGFFDSLTGLVFFLLLGKFVQQKTYNFLSFERDYKSYFPIGVTVIQDDGKENNLPIYKVNKGDRVLIRSGELIPVDGILVEGSANLDYSFVTGESRLIEKSVGQKVYAGGKQNGGIIELIVEKSVEQSYLTQLWSKEAFSKKKEEQFQTLINRISKHFTFAVLSIAFVATSYWLIVDSSLALNVLTAVLIIACPCAIALATPFTMGNLLRIFGQKGFYLKDAAILEKLADVSTFVFDKTGTLTTTKDALISYEGIELSKDEAAVLKTSLRNSNHPLSRKLYDFLQSENILLLEDFEEHVGKGIEASTQDQRLKIGSASFVNATEKATEETAVHVSKNDIYKGKFVFNSTYREGIWKMLHQLKKQYQLLVLSGDNEGERQQLETHLPIGTSMFFKQQPSDKLEKIEALQVTGDKVVMVGDGLNDAGALAQSDIGIAIAENINVFTPACDAIMDAKVLPKLDQFASVAKKGVKIIRWAFLFSFFYNVIGLYFAVTGQLMPVIAAILMPLSSVTIVAYTSFASRWVSKDL